MIERENLLQAIAYNLVRAVMQDAARARDVLLGRISFKAALTGMRQWAPLLLDAAPAECTWRYLELLTFLASDLLPVRPNRSESGRSNDSRNPTIISPNLAAKCVYPNLGGENRRECPLLALFRPHRSDTPLIGPRSPLIGPSLKRSSGPALAGALRTAWQTKA